MRRLKSGAGELWLFIVYCTIHHTSHITHHTSHSIVGRLVCGGGLAQLNYLLQFLKQNLILQTSLEHQTLNIEFYHTAGSPATYSEELITSQFAVAVNINQQEEPLRVTFSLDTQ